MGLGVVEDFAVGAVVVEFFADAISDETEHHLFDHQSGVIEVTGGFEVALAGIYPLALEIAQRRNQVICFGGFVVGEVGVIAKG